MFGNSQGRGFSLAELTSVPIMNKDDFFSEEGILLLLRLFHSAFILKETEMKVVMYLLAHNSKMWESIPNSEWQFCRQGACPSRSIFYIPHWLGWDLGYVAVPATTTRWRKRHVDNSVTFCCCYQLLSPAHLSWPHGPIGCTWDFWMQHLTGTLYYSTQVSVR